MNDYDEIDQVRREFGSLAGKVKDAVATAAQWNQARLQQAERAHDRSERARDRAAQRSERATRITERAQRHLHNHWQQLDRKATADLAIELEAARSARVGQDELVAQWAWAQAHADENPEAAADFDQRIRTEIGIDPEILRDPLTRHAAAADATVSITTEQNSVASGTEPTAPFETGTTYDEPKTTLDPDALINGLIQAAHPSQTPKDNSSTQLSLHTDLESPEVTLDQEPGSADVEMDQSGGDAA